MSWFNKWILSMLPVALLALKTAILNNPGAKATYRKVSIAIVNTAQFLIVAFADDPEFITATGGKLGR